MNETGKSKKKLIITVITAAVLVAAAGGGVAYKLHHDEQERIAIAAACEKANNSRTKAISSAKSEIKKAEEALTAATDEAIQATTPGAGTYQERGKKLIQAVTDAKQKLAKLVDAKTAKCESREAAKNVAASVNDIAKGTKTLTATVDQLSKDVDAFKVEEAARIEAERIAAEQKAAEEAAAAAAQAQAATTSYSSGYVTNNGGGYTGGSNYAPSYTQPSPTPTGGYIGSGSSSWTGPKHNDQDNCASIPADQCPRPW